MDAYMALTIHFIKKATWQRKSAVLQCRTFAESHTAENLLLALESAFSEYKIKKRLHLVVRDNAANVVKAVNDGGLKHVGCLLHGLHLVVTNSLKKLKSVATLLTKIRSIIRKFRHSTKAKPVLMKAQEREGMPQHTLIIDQETRWSSTYLMLERFLVQKKAIILAYIEFEKFGIQMLESREWAILPTVVALLKIFADVVNLCEKEDSSIFEAIPSAKSIMIT